MEAGTLPGDHYSTDPRPGGGGRHGTGFFFSPTFLGSLLGGWRQAAGAEAGAGELLACSTIPFPFLYETGKRDWHVACSCLAL